MIKEQLPVTGLKVFISVFDRDANMSLEANIRFEKKDHKLQRVMTSIRERR
jgi:hypothetical protein